MRNLAIQIKFELLDYLSKQLDLYELFYNNCPIILILFLKSNTLTNTLDTQNIVL
jgi:hypothetical protein